MLGVKTVRSAIIPLVLCGLTGCQTSSNGMSWLPWSNKNPNEAAVQSLVANQQAQARAANQGAKSSLYPPEVVHQEPLPKTEKDLKNPLQLHLSYAKFQEQLGNLTEARLSYEKVVDGEPQSIDANLGLARLDALAGRHAQAEERYRTAITIEPTSGPAYYALGEFLASQDRHTESIVELQKAVKLRPTQAEYKYLLGVELARAEQYDQSLRTLSEVIDRSEALYNIGYIVMTENKDYVSAEKFMKEALKYNPELKQARYWIAEIKKQEDLMQAEVLMASAEQSEMKQESVVHAVATQTPAQGRTSNTLPASVPPGFRPEDLTPEQWEQWRNQLKNSSRP